MDAYLNNTEECNEYFKLKKLNIVLHNETSFCSVDRLRLKQACDVSI